MNDSRRPPSRSSDARTVALDALERIESGAYANLVLPTILRRSGLDARDRAFATDLVYGTVRQRRRCDHLIGLAANRSLARLDSPVRSGLRLGTYQLLNGVQPHAAVNATVDAVGRRSPRAKGFVNAVLRKVQTMGPEWPWPGGDGIADLAVRLSYPDWIVEEFVREFGRDDAIATLSAMNEPAPLTFRPNPRRTTVDALVEDLTAAGVEVTRGRLVAGALIARGTGDPAALAAVQDGRATVQDQASQAVLDLLDLTAGLRVLDVAAAPGGKATGAGELVGDDGVVVAGDANPSRTTLIRDAARRLGVEHIVHTVAADGRALPLRAGAQFDRVLVDAPCTGLGVLRRRPEARWRIDHAAIDELVALQRALLMTGARHTAPGGVLVYSVCTVTGAETTGIDEWMATAPEIAGFVAEPPPPAPWRPRGRGAVVLPHDAGSDGMYLLRLRRGVVPSEQ